MKLADVYFGPLDLDCIQSLKSSQATPHEMMVRGNQLADSEQYTTAMSHYAVCVEKAPNEPAIWYNIGKTLSDWQRVDEAIVVYRHVTQLAPDFSSAWNNLGSAYAKTNNLDETIQCFQKTLELAPDKSGAQLGYDFSVSRRELAALRDGKPTQLPHTTTPAEYVKVLQFAPDLEGNWPEKTREESIRDVLKEMPDLRELTQNAGLDAAAIAKRDLAKHQFELLLKQLPDQQREPFSDGTAFAIAELQTPTINAEAMMAPNGGWVILIREGLMVFIYKIARIVCTRFELVDSDGAKIPRTKPISWAEAHRLLKQLFDSFVKHGIPFCDDFPIRDKNMTMAYMLATKAEQFIMCHELGHLALGHLKKNDRRNWRSRSGLQLPLASKSWEDEFEADKMGLAFLLNLSESNEARLLAYAGVELFLTICAIFEKGQGSDDGSPSHPPTSERLKQLEAHARELCVDEQSFDALMQRPRALRPLLEGLERTLFGER